jgi:NAD(P) transhydrogenase subunit alpha
MGAEFLFLDFDDSQDGAATGGYAAPSSPEFREKQLALFIGQAPEVDIVITTALIPNREAPELWTKEMVEKMKPGSVIVDLAAEKGGNCKLTVADEKIVTENGVTIIGYTDFPSRMAAQASTLYSTNIRHMVADLTPEKDGQIHHNMDDDVIRSSTVTFNGEITFPPPPPKIQAIASKKVEKVPEKTPEEKAADETEAFAKAGRQQTKLLVIGAVLTALIGSVAPADFMQHFIVFVLAIFIGFQVIWGVAHSLHTPLMAITNAISGIIVLGALLQLDADGSTVVTVLAGIAVLIATVNIVGGFMVTRRMLQMFKKS